jgi:hypothetical protein
MAGRDGDSRKTRAAALSIGSNSVPIALKILERESALRQVDGRGDPYGEDHAEIADVAVQEQQNGRHEAEQHRR